MENNIKTLSVIKVANSKAVKAASCFGERFFPLNIICVSPWINLKRLYEVILLLLIIEFVAYALNGRDTINAQLGPYFSDVHINGAVAYNNIIAPNLR